MTFTKSPWIWWHWIVKFQIWYKFEQFMLWWRNCWFKKIPQFLVWDHALRSHHTHAQVFPSCCNVNNLETDPSHTLAPWFGEQALLPETGQDRLLFLLGLLVARQDPGARAASDHQQFRKLNRLELFDHLLHQTLLAVLSDYVRIFVLVFVVPTEIDSNVAQWYIDCYLGTCLHCQDCLLRPERTWTPHAGQPVLSVWCFVSEKSFPPLQLFLVCSQDSLRGPTSEWSREDGLERWPYCRDPPRCF